MRFFLSAILISLLVFLESTIVFLPLTILFLTLLAIYEENPTPLKEEVLILIFAASLFLDLFQVRTLGTTGLIFAFIIVLISLYKKKFIHKNPVFVALGIFFSSFIYSYFFYREIVFALTWALASGFLILAFLFVKRKIYPVFLKNEVGRF